ncbi:hypothetical protein PHISP_01191 [Aspergillus sp. HF37]|nr:hypothetical protein PHISP_01191 [Aspergillus sp. HF37]
MAAALTLESLPPELQIHVLEEVPDICSLHNLVHASPVYRRTYLRSRKPVLHQLVSKAYGLVDLADPLAAVESDGLHAEVEANKPDIIAALDRRRRYSRRDRLLPESQSIPLLQLYHRLTPVLRACCARAPNALDVPESSERLSAVEKARIMRALCRLQTYCNVFGVREWVDPMLAGDLLQGSSTTTWHRHFTIDEMWSLFFRTMPPWEIEEFGSVWTFVRQMFQDLFAGIAREFSRNSPEWRDLRPASMPMDPGELYGSDDPDDEYDDNESYDDYCNHLVALGPCFLSKVLSQPSELNRRRLLASNSVTAKSSFMDLVSVVTSHQPLIYPADKYEAPNIASTLSALSEMEQPTTAWRRHWFGDGPVNQVMRATNPGFSVYPQHSVDDTLRPLGFFPGWTWGYVFWSDYDTLTRAGLAGQAQAQAQR